MNTAEATTQRTEHQVCDHCGSHVSFRWESITPGLCRTLIKFYAAICAKGKNEVHLQKEVDLSKSEFTNFQKLRYFALARKVEGRSGYWFLTWQGRDFLRNQYKIRKQVRISQNRIVDRSEETVSIGEVLNTEPYWLQRDDYIIGGRPPEEIEQTVLF